MNIRRQKLYANYKIEESNNEYEIKNGPGHFDLAVAFFKRNIVTVGSTTVTKIVFSPTFTLYNKIAKWGKIIKLDVLIMDIEILDNTFSLPDPENFLLRVVARGSDLQFWEIGDIDRGLCLVELELEYNIKTRKGKATAIKRLLNKNGGVNQFRFPPK